MNCRFNELWSLRSAVPCQAIEPPTAGGRWSGFFEVQSNNWAEASFGAGRAPWRVEFAPPFASRAIVRERRHGGTRLRPIDPLASRGDSSVAGGRRHLQDARRHHHKLESWGRAN